MAIAPSALPGVMAKRYRDLVADAEDRLEHGVTLSEDEKVKLLEARMWVAMAEVLAKP